MAQEETQVKMMEQVRKPATDGSNGLARIGKRTTRVVIDLSPERIIHFTGVTSDGGERPYILKVTRKQGLTLC